MGKIVVNEKTVQIETKLIIVIIIIVVVRRRCLVCFQLNVVIQCAVMPSVWPRDHIDMFSNAISSLCCSVLLRKLLDTSSSSSSANKATTMTTTNGTYMKVLA